jgi:hypothetical protein
MYIFITASVYTPKYPAGEFSRGLIYRECEKAMEMGTFLYRGPVKYREGGGGLFTRNSEKWLKGGS